MARNKTLKLADRTVEVHELSVSEVRAWMKEAEASLSEKSDQEIDSIALLLINDISFEDIARMSNLKVEDMDNMFPSDIALVAAACRDVNNVFFGMMSRLREIPKPREVPA